MAQYEAVAATQITIQDYDEAMLMLADIRQSITKLLLLKQDTNGRTISEQFITTDSARFEARTSSVDGPQLWYNHPGCGQYLVDTSEDTLLALRSGHGLAIMTV